MVCTMLPSSHPRDWASDLAADAQQLQLHMTLCSCEWLEEKVLIAFGCLSSCNLGQAGSKTAVLQRRSELQSGSCGKLAAT